MHYIDYFYMRRQRMKKKIFSILLSLAMVVTMMPAMSMTAFATGGVSKEYKFDLEFPTQLYVNETSAGSIVLSADSIDATKYEHAKIEFEFTSELPNEAEPKITSADGTDYELSACSNKKWESEETIISAESKIEIKLNLNFNKAGEYIGVFRMIDCSGEATEVCSSEPVTINVIKKQIGISITPEDLTYGDSQKKGYSSVSISDNAVQENDLEVKYYVVNTEAPTGTADGALETGGMPKNVDQYKVEISVPLNNDAYTGSAEATFKINKKALKVTEITIKDKIYNGRKDDAKIDKVTFDGLVSGDSLELSNVIIGGYYNADVGEYILGFNSATQWELSGTAAKNYELSSNGAPTSARACIKKASQDAPKTTEGYKYDKRTFVISIDDKYEVSSSESFETLVASGESLSAGSTYHVRKKGDKNHTTSDATSFTVEIPKTIKEIVKVDSYPYDGTGRDGFTSVKDVSNDAVSAEALDVTYTDASGRAVPAGSLKDGKPKNAGTYKVKIVVKDTAYKWIGSAEATFTINPLPVKVNKVLIKDKEYNEKADDAVVESVVFEPKAISGDALTLTGVKGTYATADAAQNIDVKLNSSDAWKLSGADMKNYTLVTADAPTTTTATIKKVKATALESYTVGCTYDNSFKLTIKSGYEVSDDTGESKTYDISSGSTLVKGETYFVRKKGDKNHEASYPFAFTVKAGGGSGEGGGEEKDPVASAESISLTYGATDSTIKNKFSGKTISCTSSTTGIVSIATDGTLTGTKAGTTTVTVKDSSGKVLATYSVTVNPKSLTNCTVDPISSQDYTGSEIKLTVITVKDGTTLLKLDTDYTVSYKNNKEIGKATVTITGKGNYTGTVTKQFSILKPLDINVPESSTTGTPKVVIKDGDYKLVKGTDYDVKYNNNTEVGYATCVIQGKGKYSEYYKEIQFKVLPKKSAVNKYTAGKKKATITWKKITGGIDGYWIRVATDKNFKKGLKKIKVVDPQATKKVVTKLKSGKRYYVKVRAYKKVWNSKTGKNENFYANWSSAKRTKTIK